MKLIYPFLLITLCFSFTFAQSNSKQKQKLTDFQKLEAKREKFDPKRDPNLDLQTAIAKAQKENKRIILDIGGEWCGWCRKMDIYLMQNKDLGKLKDKNFVWVKINMSDENENKAFLSKYPEIQGYPHLYVLEKDGTLLQSQNTAELEEPDLPIIVPSDVKDKEAFLKKEYEKKKARSYDLQKFTEFLNKWSNK
ncbi:MAG TPA: thioredoxin family protein [Pyrinomonadaceae bacterium]|nr:thioredoxin family protein [Pyrinomonadaceae bacterium]